MSFVGLVYHDIETDLGTLTCAVVGAYLVCKLMVGDVEAISVPLRGDCSITEASVRLANIINQTGLVQNPVRVELDQST